MRKHEVIHEPQVHNVLYCHQRMCEVATTTTGTVTCTDGNFSEVLSMVSDCARRQFGLFVLVQSNARDQMTCKICRLLIITGHL